MMVRLEKTFYKVGEVAALLQVSRVHVWRLIRRAELPCHQIGRCKRVSAEDLQDFLDARVTGRAWSWVKGGEGVKKAAAFFF